MPAGPGGPVHRPPAEHASARPVPGAGKRGLRRPEGPRRAGGRAGPRAEPEAEMAGAPRSPHGGSWGRARVEERLRGERSCCANSGSQPERKAEPQPGPACAVPPPFAGSVAGVKSARVISGELPGRAGLGALASLFSQMRPHNSSERHRACLKGYLVACKTTPLRQASLCQPHVRPLLAIWSNSGVTSGRFSFVQGALQQMRFLVLGNFAVNMSARKTAVFQVVES